MNRSQRHLIKEAYQEGYYQALEENLGKRFGQFIGKKLGGLLKNLFRSKKVNGVVTPTTPTEVLNKIDDMSKKLDQVDDLDVDTVYVQSQPPEFDVDNLDAEIPDITDLMKKKYGVDQFGNIDPDKANKAIRNTPSDPGMRERAKDRLREMLKLQRLQDYADNLGIDIDDIPPDVIDDIADGLDDIDLDDLLGGG